MKTIGRFLLLMLLAGGLPACATISTGTTQPLTVTTQPAGANCTLSRNGGIVGIINSTPGTVWVDKSMRQISISCSRGRATGLGTATPQFQAWTIGNLIIGGLTGVIIDLASGAVVEYPSTVGVAMVPTGPNPAVTDPDRLEQAMALRRADIRQDYDTRMRLLMTTCPPNEHESCRIRTQTLLAQRDVELDRNQ